MKKFLCFVLIISALIGFTSCGKKEIVNYKEENEIILDQEKSINNLGRTLKGSKLVAFHGENEYIEYIVANYNKDDGTKADEMLYRFYISEYCYNNAKKEITNPETKTDNSIWMISYPCSTLNTGSFQTDYDKIKENYKIK